MEYKYVMLSFLLLTSILYPKIITGEYTYNYGDSESLLQARSTCKKLAVRNALESFVLYLESHNEVRDYITEKDEIISMSVGFVHNIEIVSKTEDKTKNIITMSIKGEVDQEKVINNIKKSLKERKDNKDIKPSLSWDKYTEQYIGYQKVGLFSMKKFHCYNIIFEDLDFFISEKSRSGVIYQYRPNSWKIKQAGIDKVFSTKIDAIKGLFKKLKLGKDLRDYIIKK